MPLCLADDSTRVILAGDHMQMVPRVYSEEARSLGFDRSLTERLDHLYSTTGDYQQFTPVIRLHRTYRCSTEITEFISSTLYDGRLVSMTDQQSVPGRPPLNFYTVCGREVQNKDSTSFYNESEVKEVVRRVKELYCHWPSEQWGDRNDGRDILVTAAYSDQVITIGYHSQ